MVCALRLIRLWGESWRHLNPEGSVEQRGGARSCSRAQRERHLLRQHLYRRELSFAFVERDFVRLEKPFLIGPTLFGSSHSEPNRIDNELAVCFLSTLVDDHFRAAGLARCAWRVSWQRVRGGYSCANHQTAIFAERKSETILIWSKFMSAGA